MTARRIAFASLLLGLAAPAAAQRPATAPPFALRDGVLVEPGRSTLYLMSPEGAVEAVDVALGEVRWRSAEAARPLALAGGRLIAQAEPGTAGELRLVLLDAGSGRLRDGEVVPLPAGARATVDDGLGRSFSAHAQAAGERATVWWSFTRRVVRGTAPEPGEPAEETSFSGAVRVDAGAGTVRSLAAGEVPAEPVAPPPDLGPGERIEAVAGRQFRSADGRHVLVSERIGDDRTWANYRWTVFERAGGTRVGAVERPVSYAPFLVAGTRLIVESRPSVRRTAEEEWLEEPLEIRALDLVSGVELWRRPLRDTSYRGPMPP